MEWIQPLHGALEESLAGIVYFLEFLLESVSILCVLIGFVKTLQLAWVLRRQPQTDFPFIQVRLKFGIWLALALEFQLGADILTTTVTPSSEALAQLVVIAIIRTFLNYFLNKEIQEQIELQEKKPSNL